MDREGEGEGGRESRVCGILIVSLEVFAQFQSKKGVHEGCWGKARQARGWSLANHGLVTRDIRVSGLSA